jgi:hypothetical protein
MHAGDWAATAGGTVGYNRQAGSAVFGVETDFNWTSFDKSVPSKASPYRANNYQSQPSVPNLMRSGIGSLPALLAGLCQLRHELHAMLGRWWRPLARLAVADSVLPHARLERVVPLATDMGRRRNAQSWVA